MSILRAVDKAIKNMNKSLSISTLEREESKLMFNQLEALKELKSYIETGSWLRRDAREKFQRVLANDFDYQKVAQFYKTTPTSIRVSVSLALNRLKELVGKDIVTRILQGDPDEAMRSFHSRTGTLKLSEFYARDILKLMPHAEKDNLLTLKDCKAEAELLADLTLRSQKNKLSTVDQTKVAYLLSILKSNKDRDLPAKTSLLDYLDGGVPWDTVVTSSQKVSVYVEDAIFDQYIFNRLSKEIAFTKLALYNSRDSIAEQGELEKLRALRLIENYVKNFNWLPDDTAKAKKVEVLRRLFETNYDYQTVAQAQNVSLKQMENFISRESNEILKTIGNNTLDLIIAGQVAAGIYQFTSNVGFLYSAG